MSAALSRLRPWHLAAVGVVVAAVAHVLWYAAPFEDAYITFRYADNWAAGHGLRFNPGGESVEGFSSLLWFLGLGVAARIGLGPPDVAAIASLVFGAVLLVIALIGARRIARVRGAGRLFAPALVASTATFAYWSGTGMETTLFATVIAASVVWSDGAKIPAICLALAVLTRTEGMAYGLAAVIALAATRRWRDMLITGGAIAVATIGVTVWRLATFGDLLPNPYYAKASPSLALFTGGLKYVEGMLSSHLLWLVGPAIALVLARPELRRRLALAIAMIAAAIATSVAAGLDAFSFYRFLLPALVPMALVITAAGRILWDRRGGRLIAVVAAVAMLAASAAAPHGASVSIARKGKTDEVADLARIQRINLRYFEIGRFLRDRFTPQTTIALNAIGIIGYVSELRVVDMLGLTDRHIAHRDIELGHGASGHEKHDAAYILSREPDVIILGLPLLIYRPPANPRELAMLMERRTARLPGDRQLWESAEFRARYRPWAAPVGGGFLVLFVRADSAP